MRWKPFPRGLFLALCLSAAVSRAAVFTWDGGGTTNDNWSTAANWVGDVAPPNDGTAAIVFSGATRLTPAVNANWSIQSLSFDAGAGAFKLGGNQLTIDSGGITNNSPSLQAISDPIVLGSGQTWNASSAALSFGVAASVDTSGFPLVISGGSGTTIGGPVTNSGTIHVNSGSATFNGTLTNSGSLIVDSSGSVGLSQPYTAAGSITNNGYLVFGSNYSGTVGIGGTGSAFFSGGVSTGAGATASLNFGGGVTIFNELLARLAGPTSTQYDSLNVAGILSLNGTLDVALAGGFMPAAGSTFNLLHWGVRSGGFKTINLPALGPTVAWSTLKLYSDGSIATVDANLVPGDLSHNTKVDAADVSALEGALCDLSGYQNGRGLTDSQLRQVADINGDTKVNNLDLQALLNFEAQLAATGTASIAAVPEPPAVELIAFGGLAVLLCHSRMMPLGVGLSFCCRLVKSISRAGVLAVAQCFCLLGPFSKNLDSTRSQVLG
jgi:hypothetical protein